MSTLILCLLIFAISLFTGFVLRKTKFKNPMLTTGIMSVFAVLCIFPLQAMAFDPFTSILAKEAIEFTWDYFTSSPLEALYNYILVHPIMILFYISGVASIIAKATPNETDNKIVSVLQKIVDFLAMSTGKTEFRKKE